MRHFSAGLGVLLIAMAVAPSLSAQQPAAPYASTSLQPPPYPCVPPPAPPGAVGLPPGPLYDREPPFAVDLMLGQETGVRAQVALLPGRGEGLFVEAFYGMLFHDLGSSEALGTGARYLFRERWPDGWNSVMFGPGVDVFFQLNHNALVLLTPSIDLAWVHTLGPGLEFELGLDAGLGVGVAGRTRSGHSGAGEVTTLLSLFTGFRF